MRHLVGSSNGSNTRLQQPWPEMQQRLFIDATEKVNSRDATNAIAPRGISYDAQF